MGQKGSSTECKQIFQRPPPPPFIWVRGKELFTGSQNKWVFLHLGCHHSGAIRCYVNSDWKTWTGIKGYEGKRLLRASHQRIGQKQHIKKCLKSQTREKKKKKEEKTTAGQSRGSSTARFMLFIAIKWEHYEHLQLWSNYLVRGAEQCY